MADRIPSICVQVEVRTHIIKITGKHFLFCRVTYFQIWRYITFGIAGVVGVKGNETWHNVSGE